MWPRLNIFGDTWEWDGRAWTEIATSGPSPRYVHGMAYDEGRARVVVFGGYAMGGFRGDTWEWDGHSWAQVASTGPSPRVGAAMAYDAARQRVVLFGGLHSTPTPPTGTWEWDGQSWARTATAGPSARHSHAMAYDPARRRVVLFGGWDQQRFPSLLGDTWEWDGATWLLVASTGASPRANHAMTGDTARERVVLFGGRAAQALDDTWEWDGTEWTPIPSRGPHRRHDHSMVFDPDRQHVLIFGGAETLSTSVRLFWDSWTYAPTARGAAARIGFGCPGSVGVPTLDAVGPPILGNREFALQVAAVPASASVFVGLSARLVSTSIPPCTVYPELPFLDVLTATATGATAEIPLPIPWDASLSGRSYFAQGGALDPGGVLFGALSATPGLQIRIGD